MNRIVRGGGYQILKLLKIQSKEVLKLPVFDIVGYLQGKLIKLKAAVEKEY